MLYGTREERCVAYLKDKECVENLEHDSGTIEAFFNDDEFERPRIEGVVGYAAVLADGKVRTLEEPDYFTSYQSEEVNFNYTTDRDGRPYAEIVYGDTETIEE